MRRRKNHGVAESFAWTARGQRIATEAYPADWDRLGEEASRFRNREMLRAGAGLCLVVHRSVLDAGTKARPRSSPQFDDISLVCLSRR
jgi:hypothetical protein